MTRQQRMRMLRVRLGATLLCLLAGCAATPGPRSSPLPGGAPPSPPSGGTTTGGPAPGQWQLVLEVEDTQGAGKSASQTMSLCSTPEDRKHWQDMVGGKSAAGCTVKDYTASEATISYAMQCGGGIEGRTTIRIVDADHYRGESTLTLAGGPQPAVIRSKVSATRLAPACRK